MTFGEMRKWTERFNQILGGAQCLKQKRLQQLIKDIEESYVTYGPNQDVFAASLESSIWEELEEVI